MNTNHFPSVRVPEICARTPGRPGKAAAYASAKATERLGNALTILRGLEVDGLISTLDGETFTITPKGKELAAQYGEAR